MVVLAYTTHFFRGQLTIVFILGILFSIGFSIVDIRLAIIFGFTAGLMRKDVGITTEMAQALGVPMPMGNHIRDLFEFFIWLDGPDQEVNHYIRYIEKWAEISIRA